MNTTLARCRGKPLQKTGDRRRAAYSFCQLSAPPFRANPPSPRPLPKISSGCSFQRLSSLNARCECAHEHVRRLIVAPPEKLAKKQARRTGNQGYKEVLSTCTLRPTFHRNTLKGLVAQGHLEQTFMRGTFPRGGGEPGVVYYRNTATAKVRRCTSKCSYLTLHERNG